MDDCVDVINVRMVAAIMILCCPRACINLIRFALGSEMEPPHRVLGSQPALEVCRGRDFIFYFVDNKF